MNDDRSKIFLSAEWRYLAMLNYEVDPDVLLPLVPPGTELDRWNDHHYLSVVGFMFLRTKVLGIPIPFHRNFEEVNLRFYVRRKSSEGWRRGVVFIKEIVPRRAIALVARVVYNENYQALPMRHRIVMTETISGSAEQAGSDRVVEYGWRINGEWNRVSVCPVGEAQRLVAGSEEEFITEHYWGYARQARGGCVEYQVEHPSWRVWQVSDHSLECDVDALYGKRFSESLGREPRSAFLAEGSEVIVRKGMRLERDQLGV